jgi:hypothetical protein
MSDTEEKQLPSNSSDISIEEIGPEASEGHADKNEDAEELVSVERTFLHGKIKRVNCIDNSPVFWSGCAGQYCGLSLGAPTRLAQFFSPNFILS